MRIASCIVFVLALSPLGSAQDRATEVPKNTAETREQTEKSPAFWTPIATSSEEAIEFQIIEGLTFPQDYKTELFSLGDPIPMRVGREINASRTIGRNIHIRIPIDLSTDSVERLVEEACFRMPFSSWRENRQQVAKRASRFWDEAKDVAPPMKRFGPKFILTEFYRFRFDVAKLNTDDQDPELAISCNAMNAVELHDEIFSSIKPKLGMFIERNRSKKPGEESDPNEWYSEYCSMEVRHYAIIEESTLRWPTLIEFRFAPTPNEWSTIIGTKSSFTDDKTSLVASLRKALERVPTKEERILPIADIKIPTEDGEESSVVEGIRFVVKRLKHESIDHIEVRFRYRPE